MNSYIFVNGFEKDKFKAKDYEINATPLRLRNVSKDCLIDNMKTIGLYGYLNDFWVDYDRIVLMISWTFINI